MGGTKPRVIVHGIGHARAALGVAGSVAKGLVLESAAGGGAMWGGGAWAAMEKTLRAEFPDAEFLFVLDCADDWGTALAALRAGVTAIRVAGPESVRGKIRAIAQAQGARLVDPAGPVFDPIAAGTLDPDATPAAFRRWLAKHGG